MVDSRKLIAFDSDDTIVYHESHGSFIRDSSIRAVRLLQENGHVVALSTGRPAAFSMDVMEAIGIDSGVFVNGNSIVVAGREIAAHHLNTDEMRSVRRWISEEQIEVFAFDLDHMYFTEDRDEPIPRGDRTFSGLRELVLNHVRPLSADATTYETAARRFEEATREVSFLMVRATDEQLADLRSHLATLELVPWAPGFWEFRNRGVTKLSGVLELAEHFGIPRDHTVCFGDSFNDIEMLAGCGVGIAMGNANEAVKKHADHVTGPSNEDGIWDACQELELI